MANDLLDTLGILYDEEATPSGVLYRSRQSMSSVIAAARSHSVGILHSYNTVDLRSGDVVVSLTWAYTARDHAKAFLAAELVNSGALPRPAQLLDAVTVTPTTMLDNGVTFEVESVLLDTAATLLADRLGHVDGRMVGSYEIALAYAEEPNVLDIARALVDR